jgi:flavin-dependent dehydrogenase
MKIDKGDVKLESYPISYDYRGFQFGNIFLAGEAGGLASGLTGEGIYQSLASGREIARMILDPKYSSELMNEVVAYNRMLQKVMNIFRWSGPARNILHEFLVFLMTRKRTREKINGSFS